MALAGVYPTAVKLISQWFSNRRGIAIGILIGALSLGSALPHFVVMFFSSVNWKFVIIVSSILALISSVITNWILVDAPTTAKSTPVSFRFLKKVITNKPVMFANYGYFGHQWELYAMWTWLPVFLTASFMKYSPQIDPFLAHWFLFFLLVLLELLAVSQVVMFLTKSAGLT